MPILPLRTIGSGGLVPDQMPYDVELTQFPHGDNVQFTSGRLGKMLGFVTAKSLSFQPTHVAPWLVDGDDSVVIGGRNRLYRFNGTSVTDVTSSPYSSGGYSNSEHWYSNQIGSAMLMNNGADIPQYMDTSMTAFQNLPNWPTGVTTGSLRPFLSFLVMTGYSTATTEHPYTVRWSDEFDPTTVPGSYDITSTTNLAGENILGGRYGRLVDSLPLSGSMVVYAERGSYLMQFVGAPLVFSFRELFGDDGIINPGACCLFNGMHFVVGHNDIYVHDGSSKKTVAYNRVKEAFYGELADVRSIVVTHDQLRSDIWVCFADKNAADSQTANRAYVWNYAVDAWTVRDLPNIRSLAVGPGVGDGGLGTGSAATWDSLNVTWDAWSANWNDIGANTAARDTRLFSASYPNSKLFAHNESYSAGGQSFTAFVEATKIDLDKVMQRSVQNVMQIKRILPQMNGVGKVTFKIGYSNAPQAPVTWKTVKEYDVENDYKVDTRVSGRYLAIRVESSSTEGYWQLGGFDLDVEEVSER